ncbi:unnamed protein product, partial [Meganyctiphanes norvegica]
MLLNTLNFLKEQVLCRDAQINLLCGLIGEDDMWMPSCLFLYGHSGVGKTHVITSVLQQLDINTCHVNAVELYTPRVMYETILNRLSGTVPSANNDYASYVSCDNLGDFVRNITDISKEKEGQRMAIVLDWHKQCEMVLSMCPQLLFLIRENQNNANIMVVLTSTLPMEKFRASSGFMEPIIVHFPQYTKDQLLKILLTGKPTNYSEEFYTNYVNLALSVFYLASKSLPELRHMIELNFSAYCEPVDKGEATENDVRKLWRNIEPHLKKALTTVYLREVSSVQFERMQKLTDPSAQDISLPKPAGMTKIELPFYSKFLLIAAYLASYNPAKTDKRFFMKHHGKQRKTQAMIKAKERSSNQLVGPKPFPLDRLMAIFYSIIEDKVSPTANLFTQISTLVTLRLVSQVGGEDQLDLPKYKCTVSLDFIRGIARTVGFDVVRYLYDFA